MVAAAVADAAAETRRSSPRRSPRRTSRSTSRPSATSKRTRRSRCGRRSPASSSRFSFHEGEFVKEGQLLFTLDRRPFEAALAQADANLNARQGAPRAGARRSSARDAANAEYMQLTAERQTQLNQRGIISKDAAEQVARRRPTPRRALVKADKANIESAKAQLVAQDAAVDTARVQLELQRNQVADRRPHRQLERESRQPRHREPARDDHRSRASSRSTSPSPCRRFISSTIKQHMGAEKLAGHRDAAGRRRAAGDRRAHVRRQRGRHDDRHHQAEGDVRQRRPPRSGPDSSRASSLRLATLRTRSSCRRRRCRPARTASTCSSSKTIRRSSSARSSPRSASTRTRSCEKGLKPGEMVVTEGQLRLEPGSRVTTDQNATPAGRGRGGRGARSGSEGSGQGQGQGRS